VEIFLIPAFVLHSIFVVSLTCTVGLYIEQSVCTMIYTIFLIALKRFEY